MIHTRRIDDTLTPLGVTLQRPDGSAVDLTGLTVEFKMIDTDGTAVVSQTSDNVTVTDATAGTVTYDFDSTDVDTAGTYYGYFVTSSGGEYEHFPVVPRQLTIVINND